MQRIQLTKEQELKLLEMCNKLYPGYNKIHIHGAWLYFNRGTIPLDTIPWFEFCMTYLSQKLLFIKPILSYEFDDFIQKILIDKTENPIDYLYKIFNKLKS